MFSKDILVYAQAVLNYMYVCTMSIMMFKGVGGTRKMESVLSTSEVLLATSYWPTSDIRMLNHYQNEAIKLAWNNKFTMIQGPPGTYTVDHFIHTRFYLLG